MSFRRKYRLTITFVFILTHSGSFSACLAAAEVNVDDFGAVGDGTTYDHKAIQQAINAAGVNGTVDFSAGKTYNVCRQLYPQPGQSLIGNGATLRRCNEINTVLTQDAQEGDTKIYVADSSGYEKNMYVYPVRNDGLRFADGEHHVRHLVRSIDNDEITFAFGLAQSYSAGDTVTNEFHLIKLNGDYNTIDGFVFDGNRENNDTYVAWTKDMTILGNGEFTVRNSLFKELKADGISVFGTDTLIERNIFRDTNTSAVHLSNNRAATDVVIQDNLFVNTSQQSARAGHAEGMITISMWANHLRVLNNYAADATRPFIARFHRDMEDWTIQGNQVFDTEGLFFGEGGQTGHPNIPLNEIVWFDNYAENVGESSLERFAGWATNIQFDNNTINGGTLLFDGIVDESVQNNVLRDCQQDVLQTLNNVNVTVANNMIDEDHCLQGSAGTASLIYDSNTGNVKLKAANSQNGEIARFAIAHKGDTSDFRTENLALPFVDTGSNTQVLPFLIGQFEATPIAGTATIDLGNIFPTGFATTSEIDEYFLLSRYTDVLGRYGQFDVFIASDFGCDLNQDGDCTVADLNLMYQQGDLVDGVLVSFGDPFDMDVDGDIDKDDISQWLADAAIDNGYSTPFRRGDTDNIDNVFPTARTTDITDYSNFLIGFNGTGSTWMEGNFNGDGNVDITDFSMHFVPNFVASSGATYGPTAPEPSTLLLLSLGGVLLSSRCFSATLIQRERGGQ